MGAQGVQFQVFLFFNRHESVDPKCTESMPCELTDMSNIQGFFLLMGSSLFPPFLQSLTYSELDNDNTFKSMTKHIRVNMTIKGSCCICLMINPPTLCYVVKAFEEKPQSLIYNDIDTFLLAV